MNSSKPPSKDLLEHCHGQWPEEPLPTAEEIEADQYSTDQVARMHQRIAELEAALAKLTGANTFGNETAELAYAALTPPEAGE